LFNSWSLNSKSLNSPGGSDVVVVAGSWEASSELVVAASCYVYVYATEWETSSTLTVKANEFDLDVNLPPPLSRCFISTKTFYLYSSWVAPLSSSQQEKAA